MLMKTNRYVTHSNKNKDVYSDEFSSIILLSCSELDSLFKQLCIIRGIKSKGKHFQIKDYAPLIKELFTNSLGVSPSIGTLNNDSIILFPFNNIDVSVPYADLIWWEAYQAIKHNRIQNVVKGSLSNAILSVAAHFLVLRELIEYMEEPSVREHLQKNYWTEYWIPVL